MPIAKARKATRRTPAENFESRALASVSPKRAVCLRVGFRHISANAHTANNEKSVTAVSVRTSGPNVRKTGALT